MSFQAWHAVALLALLVILAAICLLVRAMVRGYHQGRAEAAAEQERNGSDVS